MTKGVVSVLCCDAVAEEAGRAAILAGLARPNLVVFEAGCHKAATQRQFPLRKIRPRLERAELTVSLCMRCHGGPSAVGIADLVDEEISASTMGELILGPHRAAAALADGYFMVLPGWLRRWRRVIIDEWRLDQPTARELFGECHSGLLYLNTGDRPGLEGELEAMADYVGLAAKTTDVDVGLLATRLAGAVALARERKKVEHLMGALRIAQTSAADNAVLADVVREIGSLTDEAAIRRVLVDTALTLFAPGRAVWRVADEAESATTDGSDVRPHADGDGFDLRVCYRGRHFGTLHVRRLAAPDRLEHYRPLALILAEACGLAFHAAAQYSEQRRLSVALAEKVEELDAFVYTVSHDLKAPLRAIAGYAQLLAEDHVPDMSVEARHYTRRIVSASERMRMRIDDLLTLSRVGRQQAKRERFPLEQVVTDTLECLSAVISERNARVEVGVLPEVCASRHWVGETLQNLVHNAIAYNPGPTPLVWIDAASPQPANEHAPPMAVIRVRDDGRGIARADQDRIFSLFERLGRPGDGDGSGAGLAIARKAVEWEGGALWVESAAGEAATFHFTLPLASAKDDA